MDRTGMWRWDEEQRRVKHLEAQRAGDEIFFGMLEARHQLPPPPPVADPFASPPSRYASVTLRQQPDGSMAASLSALDALAGGFATGESSTQHRVRGLALRSPELLVHVGACVFAVHMKVAKLRCNALYRKLLLLVRDRVPQDHIDRHPVTGQQPFSLRVLSRGDEGDEGDEPMEPAGRFVATGHCPLARFDDEVISVYGRVKPAWLFTRCVSHWFSNQRLSQHGDHQQHLDPGCQFGFASPGAKTELRDAGDCVALVARKDEESYDKQHEQLSMVAASGGRRRDIAHVELLRADPEAFATVMEFIYTKKVRFVNDNCAEQVSRLCEWLDLKGALYYRALDKLIARVTPRTWMDLLCRSAAVSDVNQRQVLIQRLLDFMPTLRPEHYQELMHYTDMNSLGAIADRKTLIKVVVAFIHYARMLDIWWNLFSGLESWLEDMSPLTRESLTSATTPSLLALHKHYAPWDPVVLIPKLEFYHRQQTGASVSTIAEFGEFVIQLRFELDGTAPILWRVIKRDSPNYRTGESIKLESNSKALKGDPQFCIRGQFKVQYQRPSKPEVVVKEEVSVEYQHRVSEYGNWQPLVSSMSTTARLKQASNDWWNGYGYTPSKTIARLRGRLFILDTLCNLYHYLLTSTLFYCPPTSAPPDISDLIIVQEMQRLPLETLILVLLSDRLRIPGGETTLVRILTKLIFDAPPGQFSSTSKPKDPNWRGFNGTATEVVQIFRCVRWCFVQLPQIMKTLARAPRCLRLYELIHDGLQHTHLRFRRRAPWGWQHTRDVYSSNTTNLAEFEIEAGDEHVSPSQVELPEDIDDMPDFPPVLPGVA